MFVLLATSTFLVLLSLTVKGDDFWQCPENNEACQDPDCSYTDTLRRARVLCDVYPWYAGSIGEDWTWEGEWYECQSNVYEDFGVNFCMSWSANEVSNTEMEVGTCQCQTPAIIMTGIYSATRSANESLALIAASKYCDEWICSQMEFDYIETVSCSYGDRGAYYDYNSETYVCPENEFEFTECECTLEHESGLYCQEWYCEEETRNSNSGDDGGVEREWYTCVSDQPQLNTSNFASAENYAQFGGNFCWEWTGKIDSHEEFEFSTCYCVTPGENGTYCAYWECDEKEFLKINMGLSAAFWISWIIGFIYYCNFSAPCWIDCDKECYWIPLLVMCPFLFLCLISGGLTAVLFFLMLNVLVCFGCGCANDVCDCDMRGVCDCNNWDFDTKGKKFCCLDCYCVACDIECGIDLKFASCLRGDLECCDRPPKVAATTTGGNHEPEGHTEGRSTNNITGSRLSPKAMHVPQASAGGMDVDDDDDEDGRNDTGSRAVELTTQESASVNVKYSTGY